MALALYINLFLWINFVLASAYDVQQRHQTKMRLRYVLFGLFGMCAALLVFAPVIVLGFLECEGMLDSGITIFIATTLSVFAIVIPVLGSMLLVLLKRHFFAFYLTIRASTTLLLVCQGAAFMVRAAFNFLRLMIEN